MAGQGKSDPWAGTAHLCEGPLLGWGQLGSWGPGAGNTCSSHLGPGFKSRSRSILSMKVHKGHQSLPLHRSVPLNEQWCSCPPAWALWFCSGALSSVTSRLEGGKEPLSREGPGSRPGGCLSAGPRSGLRQACGPQSLGHPNGREKQILGEEGEQAPSGSKARPHRPSVEEP